MRQPIGDTSTIANLRQAERYLPDNIYTALEDFRNAAWTTKLLGEDVKARCADLKGCGSSLFYVVRLVTATRTKIM